MRPAGTLGQPMRRATDTKCFVTHAQDHAFGKSHGDRLRLLPQWPRDPDEELGLGQLLSTRHDRPLQQVVRKEHART